MNRQTFNELLRVATARGILPQDATSAEATRPWPIVLMTGLGAWLAAVPLFALMFMIFGTSLLEDRLGYFLGLALMAGAVAVLRRPLSSVFIEQLCFPILLVGGGLLGGCLYFDLPSGIAGALVTLLILVTAWLVPRDWVRMLLGALACLAFIVAVSDFARYPYSPQLLGGMHVALLGWLVVMVYCDGSGISADKLERLATMETISSGWIAAVLLALTQWTGSTFLGGSSFGQFGYSADAARLSDYPLWQAGSLILALGAAVWLTRHWKSLRAPRMLAAIAMLALLAWLMPSLGAALLVLAVCAASGRWRLAVAAAIAAAWIIGAFYYLLVLPLAVKAAILIAIGAGFGLLGWLGRRSGDGHRRPASSAGMDKRWRQAGIAGSLVAILAVVNIAIWQKENLISTGRPVFVELAPADPRSLMQGDYMALNFRMPAVGSMDTGTARHVKAVAKVDGRGVAVMQGLHAGQALAGDEILIELVSTGEGLRPATDAWYFQEGEAERWARARFGEFRIDGQGRALLVGLRGANLEKL